MVAENVTLKEKCFKALKPALIWLVIFLLLTLVVSFVVYNGFFVGIPSSAIFLENFNELERVKTWSDLKDVYPALDPQNLPPQSYVNITVTSMSAWEEFTRPKELLGFHVRIQTDLSKLWLKLPSILVLLLDQNGRVRGKTYIQQTSEDFFLTGNNETEYTLWFRIPSNMRGQNYRVVVELFGVVELNKEIDYGKIKSPQYFFVKPQPFLDYDDIYGILPSWYYVEDSTTSENRYLLFLAFNDYEANIPEHISIYVLASYAWLLTGVILTFSTLIVLARKRIKTYWKRNSVYVTFAILFVLFFAILFVIFVLNH